MHKRAIGAAAVTGVAALLMSACGGSTTVAAKPSTTTKAAAPMVIPGYLMCSVTPVELPTRRLTRPVYGVHRPYQAARITRPTPSIRRVGAHRRLGVTVSRR